MTTSESGSSLSATNSQPESLDLDFDDWEGQFEFLGNQKPSRQKNRSSAYDDDDDDVDADDDDDDLHFATVPKQQQFDSRLPVLVDEETFLSLNPNDLDNVEESGPTSELFIENYVGGPNQEHKKFVGTKFHAEELINFKNKLLWGDEFGNMKGNGIINNNNNNINNEMAADLCDNLTEQVGL